MWYYPVMSLKGKTLFITGSSRGIGHSIALKAAKDGANIAIIAKTVEPHPKLPGTIHTAAQDMIDAGGNAIAIQTDLRYEEQIEAAIEQTVKTFGGIDICVNNASSLYIGPTIKTPTKRFDLMNQINARGTYLTSKHCFKYLKKSKNPHLLMISPPLSMDPKWFKPCLGWAMAKIGMSMCVLGLAEEFKKNKIAVNALWPRSAIATAAVKNVVGGSLMIQASRHPDIMGDAAYEVLTKKSKDYTGHFLLDEDVLRQAGVTDFTNYAVNPKKKLQLDFFVDEGDNIFPN